MRGGGGYLSNLPAVEVVGCCSHAPCRLTSLSLYPFLPVTTAWNRLPGAQHPYSRVALALLGCAVAFSVLSSPPKLLRREGWVAPAATPDAKADPDPDVAVAVAEGNPSAHSGDAGSGGPQAAAGGDVAVDAESQRTIAALKKQVDGLKASMKAQQVAHAKELDKRGESCMKGAGLGGGVG